MNASDDVLACALLMTADIATAQLRLLETLLLLLANHPAPEIAAARKYCREAPTRIAAAYRIANRYMPMPHA